MTRVNVLSGDITQVDANGLITAINPWGDWRGGIDKSIMRVSGMFFHEQAANESPLSDGQVVYARAMDSHGGRFGSVLFVVDAVKRPLRQIVDAGLRAGEEHALATLTIPTIRTGVAAGLYESDTQAALVELVAGIGDFVASSPNNVEQIHIVVYDDPASERYLTAAFPG